MENLFKFINLSKEIKIDREKRWIIFKNSPFFRLVQIFIIEDHSFKFIITVSPIKINGPTEDRLPTFLRLPSLKIDIAIKFTNLVFVSLLPKKDSQTLLMIKIKTSVL